MKLIEGGSVGSMDGQNVAVVVDAGQRLPGEVSEAFRVLCVVAFAVQPPPFSILIIVPRDRNSNKQTVSMSVAE